jgi:tRNA-Thr(GGU) m(6)t(6)A37 methyltransferase TsaA
MKAICHIQTPFVEKFGVPRQSLLIPEARGVMSFAKNDFYHEAFRGIEESSHLWLIFEFHQVNESHLNGLVRPPRFEGKKKLGVYATRTPHRPNRLGLSVVKFEEILYLNHEIQLHVSGVDLVNGTPILDIKPYVPYCDSIAATSPFTQRPEFKPVVWLCEKVSESALIEKVIALDPRPGQDKESSQEYGVSIAGYNVRFRFSVGNFEIISAIRFE